MTVLPRAEFLATLESFRASAALVVRDAEGRVLMLRTTAREALGLPGGCVEPGEAPAAAAAREALEEIGLPLAPGRLLCVDHWPARAANPSAMLHFLFDGGVVDAGADLALQEGEVTACAFLPEGQAVAAAGERMGPRLAAALRALREGTAYYCEGGVPR